MCFFFSQDFDLQAVQDQDEDPCQVKIQGPADAVPRRFINEILRGC